MGSLQDADKYTKEKGLQGHALHVHGQPPADYGIMYIPHKTLIDKDGKVVKNGTGLRLPQDLDTLLQSE
jgi:hypothetical protein